MKRNNFRSNLNSYFIPYFGNKDIDTITDVDMCKYQEWRRNYYVKGPGRYKTTVTYQRVHALTGLQQTVRRPHTPSDKPVSSSSRRQESAHLRQIFRYAQRHDHFDGKDIPKIEDPPLKGNRRPILISRLIAGLFRNPFGGIKRPPLSE